MFLCFHSDRPDHCHPYCTGTRLVFGDDRLCVLLLLYLVCPEEKEVTRVLFKRNVLATGRNVLAVIVHG